MKNLINELCDINVVYDTKESAKIFDKNGFFEIKANPIARMGVFEYLGKNLKDQNGELFEGVEPDKMYKVFRGSYALNNENTLKSFKLKPIINGHAYIGIGKSGASLVAQDVDVHGVTGEQVYFDDNDGMLKANLVFYSKEILDKIESGIDQISIGATCLYKKQNGVYNGEAYDFVQENLLGNHITIVKNGRSGALVAVLDQAEQPQESVKMADIENATREDEAGISLHSLSEQIKNLHEVISKLVGAAESKMADKESEGKTSEEEVDSDDKEIKEIEVEDEELEDEDVGEKELKKEDREEAKERAETHFMDEKEFLVKNAKRQELAEKLFPHIGVFDHATKTLSEIAKYGVEKLKKIAKFESPEAGQEYAFLTGYLSNTNPISRPVVAFDKKEESTVDLFSAYKKGDI